MTTNDRRNIRLGILHYCKKPRTRDEVRDNFGISGISAGAFIKYLDWNGFLKRNDADGTYKTDCRKCRKLFHPKP